MARQRWERIKEFFDFARGGRAGRLDRASTLEPEPASNPAAAPAPGQAAFSLVPGELVAGRYLIRRAIGRGGMGEVYEAHDSYLKESVALKTLRASLARDEGVVKRFQKEIRLARKVTHPNVCRVFETGLHERLDQGQPSLPFFTMELLAGETLLARVRRRQRLSRDEAFPIALQMAEGLQAAHAAGVVHSDFKSGNVLLIPSAHGDRAVVTDFGLAHVDPSRAPVDETRTMSLQGHVVGTMAYMSPEQMTGAALTPASDIYSFGIVLYEMATGQLPFDKQHAIQAAVQRASGEVVTARQLVPHLDSKWDTAIGRCLERAPERRFASAADLADCFRESGWRVPVRYWRRRQWLRAGLAAAIPVMLAAGFWIWSHRTYQPQPAALPWYQKGVAALHSMTYEAARKAFEQAVAVDPAFALARAGLAQAYEELDYSDLAKESMLRAVTAAQESHLTKRDARRLRALQLLMSRDYDPAVALFRQLEDTAGAPERPAAALESGWLAEKRDDTEGAAAAYQRALKMDPVYAAAKLRLGYMLQRRRQVQAALQAFQEAEDLYQASSNYEGVTEALYQRAMLLNRSSRSAEAMPVIDKALTAARAVSSTYQQIRLQLAQVTAARNLGDIPRATALAQLAIDRAIAEHMDNLATNGLIDLGNLYLARGDWASADQVFRKSLDLAGRARVRRIEARARLSLASVCELEHRTQEARWLIEAAVPFYRQAGYRRELVQAMALLGDVHEQLAEFSDGERVLREALAEAAQLHDSQTEDRIRERLSENLRDQARWPEALASVEQLLPSDTAYARVNCADLYWRLGRRDDSQQSLAEAEKLLARTPNRQLLSDLKIIQVRRAYQDGRMSQAVAAGAGEPQPEARLIAALVSIRAHPTDAGIASGVSVTEGLDQAGMLLDSASARLEIAEALVVAAKPGPAAMNSAAKLALAALAFFEPRRIWESVWRAHYVAARASQDPAEAEKHRAAARSALDSLRTLWSARTVDSYLHRPDISLLWSGLR